MFDSIKKVSIVVFSAALLTQSLQAAISNQFFDLLKEAQKAVANVLAQNPEKKKFTHMLHTLVVLESDPAAFTRLVSLPQSPFPKEFCKVIQANMLWSVTRELDLENEKIKVLKYQQQKDCDQEVLKKMHGEYFLKFKSRGEQLPQKRKFEVLKQAIAEACKNLLINSLEKINKE